MKAIQFNQFGPPEVLSLTEIAIPKCSKDQVLIKVLAAGLNPIDYKTRNGSGFVAQALKDRLPSSLGYDFSGEIVALGSNVKGIHAGDKVMGFAGFPDSPCCYAEYLCTTLENIIQKPNNVSFLEAASLPTAGLTALQALNQADVKEGDTVLIHAGAGGVGHLAVQLAKQKGAIVFTTASKRNHDFLTGLGADRCIDYREEDFLSVISSPVDSVIDLVGGEVGIQSIQCLKKSGCIVSVPTVTAEKVIEAAEKCGRRGFGLLKKSDMNELAYLANLIASEKLRVEISQVFSLDEAVTAHQTLESGRVRGKLVFKVT